MGFEPKMILAGNLDGLSGKRARRHRWLGWLALAGLTLLFPLLVWGAGGAEKIRALFRFHFGETLPPATQDVFAKMSLLSQPQQAAAPDFLLRTPAGQNHSLSEHRGKVVILNFWATWCPPCIREMPSMERLYDAYKGQGLAILAISLDQGALEEVRSFAEKLKLSFPIVLDPAHDVKNTYQVRVLPTTYVVDRQGRIIAWGMGAREWDGSAARALVEHLLGVAEKGQGGRAAADRGRRG